MCREVTFPVILHFLQTIVPSLKEGTSFPEAGGAHPLWQWLGGVHLGPIAEEINARIPCMCCFWQRTNVQSCWRSEMTNRQQKVPFSGIERKRRRSEERQRRPEINLRSFTTVSLTNQVLTPYRGFYRLWRSVPGKGGLRPHALALYNKKSKDHPKLKLSSNAASSTRPSWSP